jgi:ubiquinone/menaquinone biosynthesis C-methylase UbiE
VLDVGGGSGVYAEWLAGRGYAVTLVDPVPLHVRQAAGRPGVTAVLGDARALAVPDASQDAVLMLGPLYHLVDRNERVRALTEAYRVLRPGGTVAAASISRFAALHDAFAQDYWADPERRGLITAALAEGAFMPDDGGRFTTAYFHRPEELPGEFTDAGFAEAAVYGVEGAVWLLMDALGSWLDDPDRRALLLDGLRRVEREPSLLGASGHLLTVGRKRPAPAGTA